MAPRQGHGFALLVRDALQRPTGASRVGRYRFPNARAAQVTRTRDSLARRSLCSRLKRWSAEGLAKKHDCGHIGTRSKAGQHVPAQRRRQLRSGCPRRPRLALHEDAWPGIPEEGVHVGTLARYERVEEIATAYAGSWGYPVGCFDVAVWATMKASSGSCDYEHCDTGLGRAGFDANGGPCSGGGAGQHPLFVDYGQLNKDGLDNAKPTSDDLACLRLRSSRWADTARSCRQA